jgi:PAS domain S-box-containing protein
MREVELHPIAVGPGDESREPTPSEKALRESEAAFHELLEMAPDAVVVGDADDRITKVNTAACKLFGYSCKELLGKTPGDLLEPEEAARFVRERPAVPGLVHMGEWRVKRRDGALVPVEASVKRLPDGRSLAFIRDITERQRAERARDESLRWIRAVLEQSPVGLILVHGQRSDEVEYNDRAQQMLGRVKETAGKDRENLRTEEGQLPDSAELPIARALRGKRTVGVEFLVRTEAGHFTPVAVRAGPIVGPDGAVLGAVVAFEDITAVKELERLRAEWSSLVAHDLRQPLGTITISAQMLARATEDPKLLRGVERIRAAANRLNRMVGDLMDLSRLEASRLELVRQRVDVPMLVRAARERAELDTPGRPFDVRVQGDVPEAYADPDRIAQVLENLLTNAVKYGSAGTPITLSISREGGEVVVAVTNNGRALTAEEIAHMFERFQRTVSAKLQGIQGVGLGLYITRSLIEAHGGRITAESTPAGVTTFRFTLPVADKQER